jgi:hypothetical protein
MPILIAIASYERQFLRQDRISLVRKHSLGKEIALLRRPSMLKSLSKIKPVSILEAMFEVDSESRDDASLFTEERSQWDDGLNIPFPVELRGMPSPKKRVRVESEPSPLTPELGGKRTKKKSPASLVALCEQPEECNIKGELEEIKVFQLDIHFL